jgi:transposase
MMGTKARLLTPVHALSLDQLAPADHFYRHVDRVVDLSFVRDLVRDCYVAGIGRPSVDPIVFFRLQLVMFFEGIRSERQLLRLAVDRLSVGWYLGYNLDEPLPDHSSLTRIRTRYGLEIFRRFFDAIVAQCQQAGLVWGRELYVDATQVQADASLDSLTARFAVDAPPRAPSAGGSTGHSGSREWTRRTGRESSPRTATGIGSALGSAVSPGRRGSRRSAHTTDCANRPDRANGVTCTDLLATQPPRRPAPRVGGIQRGAP